VSVEISRACLGGIYLSLREDRRGSYTLVFGLNSDDSTFNTTPLGNDREEAVSIFNRKVEWHKAIVSGTTMEDDAD